MRFPRFAVAVVARDVGRSAFREIGLTIRGAIVVSCGSATSGPFWPDATPIMGVDWEFIAGWWNERLAGCTRCVVCGCGTSDVTTFTKPSSRWAAS
jgi:hypothetical protein